MIYPTLHFNPWSRRCSPKAGNGSDARSQGNKIESKSAKPVSQITCRYFIQGVTCSSGLVGMWYLGQFLLSANLTPPHLPTPCLSTYPDVVDSNAKWRQQNLARSTRPSPNKDGPELTPIPSMTINIDQHPDIAYFRLYWHLISE